MVPLGMLVFKDDLGNIIKITEEDFERTLQKYEDKDTVEIPKSGDLIINNHYYYVGVE